MKYCTLISQFCLSASPSVVICLVVSHYLIFDFYCVTVCCIGDDRGGEQRQEAHEECELPLPGQPQRQYTPLLLLRHRTAVLASALPSEVLVTAIVHHHCCCCCRCAMHSEL